MNILIIALLVALDQAAKLWALRFLASVGSIPVIRDIFHLTYVENRGAAFGVLQNKRWFFIVLTVVIVSGVMYFIYKNRGMNIYLKLSLDLVVAGAIGNLIDRVRLGFVVDFLDFRIWPVFNIADICVVVGGMTLAYILLFKSEMLEIREGKL